MADDGSIERAKTYFSSPDEGDNKQLKARKLVQDYHLNHVGDGIESLPLGDIYVVLFSYVLGSWKALVSTTEPDGRYYEVTYDGKQNVTYVDEYKKQNNVIYRKDGVSD